MTEAKKKRGRPKKALLNSKTTGKRKTLGRPPGEKAAIDAFKARLLASPNSKKVIDTIMQAALNDDHKQQGAAWKLLIDRIMPLSYFDKNNMTGNGKASVNISITNVDGSTSIIGEEPLEEDITDVEVTSYEES